MSFYGKPSGAFRREVLLGRRIRTEDGMGRRQPWNLNERFRSHRQGMPGGAETYNFRRHP